MSRTIKTPTDYAFSPAVVEAQKRKGSRRFYADMVMGQEISADVAGYIANCDSFYLGTASADGQPYIQHRGGPKGFLKVSGPRTLIFADYKGNRQYITTGNLDENNKVYLFLMDYMNRQRLKIWGTAKVIENDSEALKDLMPEGYRARGEQVIEITVNAWDGNCPQHIPQKVAAEDVQRVLNERDAKIKELEARVKELGG